MLVKTLLYFPNETIININLLCTLSINALRLVDNNFFYEFMDNGPVKLLYINVFRNKLDLEKDVRYAKTVEKSHGRYDMAAMKRGSVICQAKLTGWKIGEIRKSCGESVSSYLHVKLQESRKLAQPCTISSSPFSKQAAMTNGAARFTKIYSR